MNTVTTHVLDLMSGRPAAGVPIILSARAEGGRWAEIGRSVTDADGRVRDLLPADRTLDPGVYSLRFEVAAYFSGRGLETFYPEIVVSFVIDVGGGRYHVPLLLGPFGYSTYRGS